MRSLAFTRVGNSILRAPASTLGKLKDNQKNNISVDAKRDSINFEEAKGALKK